MRKWWGARKSGGKEEIFPIATTREKAKSFDESWARKAASAAKDLVSSSSLDSELQSRSTANKKKKDQDHPLPRPSGGHSAPSLLLDHGGGGVSVSASSVSSSASSSDDHHSPLDFGFNSHYTRGRPETKFSPRATSPGPGSRSPRAQSPLHPHLCAMNLESSAGYLENGKSLCHPLPLPPGSPTHQPTSPSSIRTSEGNEFSQCLHSKWKKGKLLGRGTFGHVYVGFNSDNGQMCAIKEVRLISDDQNSKECLKQLNQEITLLGQLSHPNIVQYYGSEMGEETLSVFLEYVTGGSIHKLLQEYGPFREPVIQNYTRQILLGLAYLHGRNTVHRDIKGANILVGPNGEIKLADFGMAKHITSHTSILSFKGSPYWMAPEVIMNISGYNLAVDIWSLGCTILEMATSKPPWSQFEGVAAIFKIGNSKEIPEIPDHLSNDARSFLRLCLQRDPSQRPTASQLLDHPFVREQASPKAPRLNIGHDVFPFSAEGSHTPTAFEVYSNRMSIVSQDADITARPMARSPREFRKPMETMRLNMSLPVSPSSSPLHQYGPAHRSCFLSPPPSYMLAGQSSNGPTDYLFRSARQYMNHPADESVDIFQRRSQTPPAGSPRRQPF